MARKEKLIDALYSLETGAQRIFEADDKRERTLRTTAWRLGKEEGRKFVCRRLPDGYCVARIA